MNTWQKCPICNGLGKIESNISFLIETCKCCNGKRIISQITGLPPATEDKQ